MLRAGHPISRVEAFWSFESALIERLVECVSDPFLDTEVR